MNFEPLHSIQNSQLQNPEQFTRNKHIHAAYNTIISKISNKLENNFNRAYEKFPRFDKHETKHPHIIEEFYTPICSVILYLRGRNYIIKFTGTTQCFNAGHGVNSTALLRLAFEATQHDVNGFRIHDCLEISITNDIERLYRQKVDERLDMKNLAYFKQKMKIEG